MVPRLSIVVLSLLLPAWAEDACSSATVTLSNGLVMPRVGFGTAGRTGSRELDLALKAGVRLFDTAQATEWYDEQTVAEALAESGLDRKRQRLINV